jgi:hypothetical protein
MGNRIHISAEGETPCASVRRRVGKYNAGLYCVECSEIFAIAVADRQGDIEFISDGEPLFECPFCHQQQRRQPSEIAWFLLTEGRLRKPPARPGLN